MNNSAFRRIALPIATVLAAQVHDKSEKSDNDADPRKNSLDRPKLVFIGTGSSTGCPKPICSMLFPPNGSEIKETDELKNLRKKYADRCRTSSLAAAGNPKENKNYRNNPALLISHKEKSKACKNIIIDAGKTFREGAIRWFPENGITTLDAIILTHHHMDAVGGLDDVRGFQHVAALGSFDKAPKMVPMPLHLSKVCLADVSERFPWLFPTIQPNYKTGSLDKPAVERHVASFDIRLFDALEPFDIEGLEVIPLPVWHGKDLVSYGFAFSITGSSGKPANIVYISDISQMIPETMDYIHKMLPPTDILIVDTLLQDQPHSVHFSLDQAIELSKEIGAKQTYLVGMSCDSFPPHDEMNKKLQIRFGGKVQLAYDGQVIYL